MKLFDEFARTDSTYKGRTEQDFAFLNRSADPIYHSIRNVAEAWFSKLPEKKKGDMRGRFRGDNRPHWGALFELITHGFLNAVGTDVTVEPSLNGLAPDFEATINGARILFECTVVHPSDQEVSADKREARIKAAIDTINAGRFSLGWECVDQGPKDPATKDFKRDIECWLTNLNPDNSNINEYIWSHNGWRIKVGALPFKPGICKQKGERAIGVETTASMVDADYSIENALKKKSNKYKCAELPYIIVLSHKLKHVNIVLTSIRKNSLIDALFGQTEWIIPRDPSLPEAPAREVHNFEGFFGSPEKRKTVVFQRSYSSAS